MKRILFQGDSITDAGRDYKDFWDLGNGYPVMAAGKQGLLFPKQFECVNRGISGDKTADILARVQKDVIELKPDYLSLLVGVNDVWHGLAGWDSRGVQPVSEFTRNYTKILETVRRELPNTKIILLEPFVLPGTGTNDYYDRFAKELGERAAVVRGLAEKYRCVFIPLQEDAQMLAKQAPADYWLADGVHPTRYFHQHIADKWVEVLKTIVV